MSADISRDVDQLLEVVVYREMIRRGYQGALSERAAMPGRWIPNCNPLRRGFRSHCFSRRQRTRAGAKDADDAQDANDLQDGSLVLWLVLHFHLPNKNTEEPFYKTPCGTRRFVLQYARRSGW